VAVNCFDFIPVFEYIKEGFPKKKKKKKKKKKSIFYISMETTTSQNSQITTIYNEKKITFDVPGWGHIQVSVNESMNAQNIYLFVGLDNIDINQVIYKIDDFVLEAYKDESVKFIYEKCDDKVVQVAHILENVIENDDNSDRSIENNELWQLTKNYFYVALQELKFLIVSFLMCVEASNICLIHSCIILERARY